MSSRLPIEVNPFKLVEQRKTLTGTAKLDRMHRLAELLSSIEGEVEVEFDFNRSSIGLPVIKGRLDASLELICQRCLKGLHHELHSDIDLVLIQTDEHAEKLQEGTDSWLVEDEKLYLSDFIEDEILLALPLTLMHEDCEPERPLIEALPEDEIGAEEEKQNPFAVLQNLKNSE